MIITGTASWAHILTPDDRFPPAKYSINVLVSEEEADKIKAVGLKVKAVDGGFEFKAKRNVLKADGTEAGRPNLVDASNKPFEAEVGNGSVVRIQVRPYDYNNNFGSGTSADFEGVQVLDLVEYTGGGGSEFAPVAGDL